MTTMDLVHKKLIEDQEREKRKLIRPAAVAKRIADGRARGRSIFEYGHSVPQTGGGWDRSQ